MHILLTRPLEDSREMILKFQSLGHDVSHLPLINIESKNYEFINFSDFNGIIFTSANAIKFLNLKLIDKKINCFCVGSATEKKAKNFGSDLIENKKVSEIKQKETLEQCLLENGEKIIEFYNEGYPLSDISRKLEIPYIKCV